MILIHKETADLYLVNYVNSIIGEHEVVFEHDQRMITVVNMFDIPLTEFEILGWL